MEKLKVFAVRFDRQVGTVPLDFEEAEKSRNRLFQSSISGCGFEFGSRSRQQADWVGVKADLFPSRFVSPRRHLKKDLHRRRGLRLRDIGIELREIRALDRIFQSF